MSDERDLKEIPSVEGQRKLVKELNERIRDLKKDRIKLEFDIVNDNDGFAEDKVCRIVKADDAFSLICDLHTKMRSINKYGANGNTCREQLDSYYDFVDKMLDSISESGLMEYWR